MFNKSRAPLKNPLNGAVLTFKNEGPSGLRTKARDLKKSNSKAVFAKKAKA